MTTLVYDMFTKYFKVTRHSDYVGPGTIFFAFAGKYTHGVSYFDEVIAKGASKIILAAQESSLISAGMSSKAQGANVEIVYSEDLENDFISMCVKIYGYPQKHLKIIGITGTKGKTTTTFMTAHLLRACGYKVAFLSTVHNDIDGQVYKSELTTPYNDYIYAFLSKCVEGGITHVVIEVAAQALTLKRVAGLEFDVALFTNFSQEHGEFYITQNEYFEAKKKLFKQVKDGGVCILNGDDSRVADLENFLRDKVVRVYGSQKGEYQWDVSSSTLSELIFSLAYEKDTYIFSSQSLLGDFNAGNITAALAVVCEFHDIFSKKNLNYTTEAVRVFSGVPGRFEKYYCSVRDIYCIIDHAHTESSYKSLLSSLRSFTKNLVVVFGCGGDRDRVKRPIMAGVVESYADLICVTSDNPRFESQEQIFQDISKGFHFSKKIYFIRDREEAISFVSKSLQPGSILAILGKGTQQYEVVGKKKKKISELGAFYLALK